MMDENKKVVASEVPIQEQPKFTVTISIANLDKLNTLISEITDKLKELNNFKLNIKIGK